MGRTDGQLKCSPARGRATANGAIAYSSVSDVPLVEDLADQLLTLAEIAQLVPGRGRKRVHASTVARWIARGIRTSPDGRRVRLKGFRLGSRWLSTRRFLRQFLDEMMPSFADAAEPPATDRQRDRAADEAGKRLEAMGA